MFVHGTGVRQPAYDVAFELIAKKVAGIRPEYAMASCYWGGSHGSRLNADGVSIPSGPSHRNLEGAIPASGVDADAEVALWELLDHDPLFELRILSAGAASREELAPNAEPPGGQLAEKARQLPLSKPVMSEAAAAALDGVLPPSIEAVLGSPVVARSLQLEHSLGGAVRTSLARAFVAEAQRQADEKLGGTLPLDAAHRDDLIAAIVTELGGTDRGMGSAIGRLALNTALALGATRPLERRRSVITHASAPASGDVLMYLARGDSIRDFIAEAIAAIDAGVVLLAHSLGGIASLELLATRVLPTVDLLVTVGTQAPLLYELNALPTLPYGDDLPATMPRWVNIFDRRDLLAFTGAGVFPGWVEDREVDCREPFPRSHSAYFAHERFYSVLDEILP
jgi:hypothetical protein